MEMIDIIKDCGVPPGAVNLLSGDPAGDNNSQLLASDVVKKVSITGSTRVGKIILKQAADKVQRVTMELSGHAPFIVFDDANIDKVTDVWLWHANIEIMAKFVFHQADFIYTKAKRKNLLNPL